MISTFFGRDMLDSTGAFAAALCIGLAFGFFLERAGFGSSRRLAGVFYFRDLAVIKVMFTAVITAMLGLMYLTRVGILSAGDVYFLPTVFGAQIVGGLIFGCGFVMSGWCPGTAAVGMASGKGDAAVFLVGGILGSILFNEMYSLVEPLYRLGEAGVRFVWADLGISETVFAVGFTLLAIGMFWGAETIERRRASGEAPLNFQFLRSFSLASLILATPLMLLPPPVLSTAISFGTDNSESMPVAETGLLEQVESGEDHLDPLDLAQRMLARDATLLLIDIRYPEEFDRFHLPDAVSIPMAELPEYIRQNQRQRTIVLYSNGMTHPAQARDELARMGFKDIFFLTGGLDEFFSRCLRPISLRLEPVPAHEAEIIAQCRHLFGNTPADTTSAGAVDSMASGAESIPRLVDPEWLATRLDRLDVRIIDCRPQPQYNTSHVLGSVCLNPENLRGVVGGVSSMLLPAELLAQQFSLMGVSPMHTVVIVPDDKLQDATLIALALERLGHEHYAILDGGFARWTQEKRPTTSMLPILNKVAYPSPFADSFTVDASEMVGAVQDLKTTIIDVRPHEYYLGEKSDEMRAGHIPRAVNRPYTSDTTTANATLRFKPVAELEHEYAQLIQSKEAPVMVYCRTGHQASQTYFVLRHLLGYRHVRWYDGGWTEWSANPKLPMESSVVSAVK